MPTVTERLAILVEANAGQAIAQFKTLGASTKTLSGDVGKAGGLMERFSGQLGGLGGAAGAAGVVTGVGAALAAFGATGVAAFNDLALQVDNFRRVAGGTAEEASRLVSAFDDVGVEASVAASGIFQLEKRIATSGDKLEAFGVAAVKGADGTTDMTATLLSVSDAYRRTHDPAQRAALLTAAFGKQGKDLIPLLERSRSEIEELFRSADATGQILSDEDLQTARDYRETMDDLQDSFRGLQIAAGKALVPFLTDVANAISKALQLAGSIRSALRIPDESSGHSGIGGWIDSLIHAGDESENTKVSVGHLGEALAPIDALLSGFKDETDEAADALKDLDKALSTAATADRSLLSSRRSLTDAQDDLNELMRESAVDIEKVADAQRSLDDATRSVGHAQREQSKALDDYNKALAAANILGTDTARDELRDKTDDLADANDGLASAQDRVKDAQKELDRAKAGDPDYQEKLADARQAVADAELNVSTNALAAARAHDEQTRALSANADQIERLLSDYDKIIGKSPEAAAALAPLVSALQLAQLSTPPVGAPAAPPAAPAATINSGGTSKNVTINVNSDRQIDPTHLSRTIIWEMN